MNDMAKPLPTPPTVEIRKSRSNSPRKAQKTNTSPNKNRNNVKSVPESKGRTTNEHDNIEDEEFEFFHQFSREKVKGVIHVITAELKEKGPDVEFLMIPFRPEQTNDKLLTLLNQLFPLGNGQPVNEKRQLKIISKTDVWTLFQCLKYIWCRLPNSEIIGWKSYMEFKFREEDKEFPRKSFLEIMPQCLASPNHASIVYDFFDLIISISSNSRVNKMSARKISKMCAIWAFSKQKPNSDVQDYDFESGAIESSAPNNSIQDGLDQWIPASDAMFHLLLAFLRSFVPQDLESAKLPRTLKSLLFNNQYPPRKSTAYTSETILTIPLVTLKTDVFSRKPWQLLERCNDLLDFTDHDAFEAREDYALLKSLFRKKNTVEGISRKMSQESRRLMKAMSTKHSTFQPGWAPRKCIENVSHLKECIEVKRLDIDDYFIWTWLSSLSFEQTSEKKKIFGRSIILEFEFDGFKKWVVFQECDVTLDYNKKGQFKRKSSVHSSSAEKEQPPDFELADQPLSKSPTLSQTYKKFQAEVPQQSTIQRDSAPDNQGIYHTVISKNALAKNKHNVNLHSFEHKISKWNPLNNLRKKGGSNSSSSSSFENKSKDAPIREEYHTGKNHKSKKEERVLSEFSTLNPDEYQLPVIETDSSTFKIDIPELMYEHDDDEGEKGPAVLMNNELANPHIKAADSTIEELNGMVEEMMFSEPEDVKISITEAETFESLTKFDQYKPSNITDDDLQSSHSSAIHSLKLSTNTNDSCADSSKYTADRKLVEPRKVSEESKLNDDSSSYYSPNINNLPKSRMPSQPTYSNSDSKKVSTNESRLNVLQGAANPPQQVIPKPPRRAPGNSISPVQQKCYQNDRRDELSPASAPVPSSAYSPVRSPQFSTTSAGFKQNTLNMPVGYKEPAHVLANQQPMMYRDQHNYPPQQQKQRPFQNTIVPPELKFRNQRTEDLPISQHTVPVKQGVPNVPSNVPLYQQMERMNPIYQHPVNNHKVTQLPHHKNATNAYGKGHADNVQMLDGKWGNHPPRMMPKGVRSNQYPQQHVNRYTPQAQPVVPAEYYNGPPPMQAPPMMSHMIPAQEPVHYTAGANRRSFPQSMKQNAYAVPVQPMGALNGEFYLPEAPQGNKLHGNINKRQERKKLYDNIRSGNFGI
ncbi:Msb1p [Saccharomyces paradoxus]|uniref:Msb1p n=1 Tax=Saccharomyces paradoxus TaxID=27291 RepID=A0A8B8V015_SACPA|nr:Msb1 [Saccharomyces paradoxus]QHS76286.1 Msb1 [Saccharomyces paradoxus]